MRNATVLAVFAASLAAGWLIGTRLPVWIALPLSLAALAYFLRRSRS